MQCIITEVCRYGQEYGSCEEIYPKVYFNETRRQCMKFSYSGCGGSPNKFSSVSECESLCVNKKEPALEIPAEEEIGNTDRF